MNVPVVYYFLSLYINDFSYIKVYFHKTKKIRLKWFERYNTYYKIYRWQHFRDNLVNVLQFLNYTRYHRYLY